MGTCFRELYLKKVIFSAFNLKNKKIVEFYILPMLVSLAVFVTSLMLPAVEFDIS